MPLPQVVGQAPQSDGQEAQLSPRAASQVPLPQQAPQSLGQEEQLSAPLHLPSPHPGGGGHLPQSPGQVLQSSPSTVSQAPLPQQAPQSLGQLSHDSLALGSHFPSPQEAGHLPQSEGQVEQLSPPALSHTPSPQVAGHLPQSPGQVLQSSLSLGSHFPSPQAAGHLPQSAEQEPHVSPGSHFPSPHTGLQAPQSPGQVWHDSNPSHRLLPHQVHAPSRSHWHMVLPAGQYPLLLVRPHPCRFTSSGRASRRATERASSPPSSLSRWKPERPFSMIFSCAGSLRSGPRLR